MPTPNKMEELESDLQNALEAKNAQKLMDYIKKVRNVQSMYEKDVKGEMEYGKSQEGKVDPEKLKPLIDKAEDALIELPSE